MDEFRIAIALWDGVEELDFAGPFEVLTAWSRMSERPISVRTVASSAAAVRCSHDLRVVPDTTWAEVGKLDLLVLPGGDTRPLQADDGFLERLRGVAGSGTLMTSVCTGALVYAKAGLLDGRPATTHWSALDRLADLGVNVDREARFVDDGDVVTAAGVSAGIDMALHLVARLESVERAQEVRRYIQYDPQPPVTDSGGARGRQGSLPFVAQTGEGGSGTN
jgi:transcriptional regulator GlxA family with amidase domain